MMVSVLRHTQWMILELIRQPAYVVSTISFPSIFYVIFALPESTGAEASNMLLASFSGFSVFGVVFLQFGVGIAQARSHRWYYFLKTLPVTSFKLIIARFLSAFFFSILAAGLLILISVIYSDVRMTFNEWFLFLTNLLLFGAFFCPMGLVLGYFTNESASLPVGNLIYLTLSFAGGLWKPPSILPKTVKSVSEYLPTRHYGEILWSSVKGEWVMGYSFYFLLVFLFISIVISYFGYLKDHKLSQVH